MSNVRFRFIGAEPRLVSMLPSGELRRVEPDQLFAVPAEFWESYACQPHYYVAQDEEPGRLQAEPTPAAEPASPAKNPTP